MTRGRPELSNEQKAADARAKEQKALEGARKVPADSFENIMDITSREGVATEHAERAKYFEKGG